MRMLLKTLLLPPEMLLAHARGYVHLSRESGTRYLRALQHQWLMRGLCALALLLALVFGGVALLLWSALPLHAAPQVWVLWGLPGSCLVLSGLLGWRASRLRLPPLLQDLQLQMAADLPASMFTACGAGSGLTPAQRLAVSRAQMAQALRDPAWLLLLQRWLQGIQPSHAAAAAAKGASVGAKAEPEA